MVLECLKLRDDAHVHGFRYFTALFMVPSLPKPRKKQRVLDYVVKSLRKPIVAPVRTIKDP